MDKRTLITNGSEFTAVSLQRLDAPLWEAQSDYNGLKFRTITPAPERHVYSTGTESMMSAQERIRNAIGFYKDKMNSEAPGNTTSKHKLIFKTIENHKKRAKSNLGNLP